MNFMDPRLPDSFWARTIPVPFSGCWLWLAGAVNGKYGVISISHTKQVMAHRFSYEHLIGPIPHKLEIDHKCRNTHCVNPAHLEPVTTQVNVLRGESIPARNARKTHCKYGHPFTPSNTYYHPIKTGRGKGRQCKICRDRISKDRSQKG